MTNQELRYLAACFGALMVIYGVALVMLPVGETRGTQRMVRPPGGRVTAWAIVIAGLAVLVVSLFL